MCAAQGVPHLLVGAPRGGGRGVLRGGAPTVFRLQTQDQGHRVLRRQEDGALRDLFAIYASNGSDGEH